MALRPFSDHRRGLFISIDGPSGAGKSTIVAHLANLLVKAAGIRRLPPKIMRHTAASPLVQDGVPLYDVQALLGHEDSRTTQRYAHLAPEAHDKVKASWKRRADQDHSDSDASVTHEMTKAHS